MTTKIADDREVARSQISDFITSLKSQTDTSFTYKIGTFNQAHDRAIEKGYNISDLLDQITPELASKAVRAAVETSFRLLKEKVGELVDVSKSGKWTEPARTIERIAQNHLTTCNNHLALAAVFGIKISDILKGEYPSAASTYDKIVGSKTESSFMSTPTRSPYLKLCEIAFAK